MGLDHEVTLPHGPLNYSGVRRSFVAATLHKVRIERGKKSISFCFFLETMDEPLWSRIVNWKEEKKIIFKEMIFINWPFVYVNKKMYLTSLKLCNIPHVRKLHFILVPFSFSCWEWVSYYTCFYFIDVFRWLRFYLFIYNPYFVCI